MNARPASSNSGLLFGETLSWVTYDVARTVSAAMRSLLREALAPRSVRVEIIEARTAEEAAGLVEQHRAGLLTLVLTEADWYAPEQSGGNRAGHDWAGTSANAASSNVPGFDGSSASGPALGGAGWAAACRTLRRVQVRRSACLRCVYVTQPEMASDLRLCEAGAQIVVDQIPWLQRLLPRIIEQAPRSSGGTHPITAGLVDRLPWSDI